jgi:hypothetical protein
MSEAQQQPTTPSGGRDRRESVEEQALRRGIGPVESVEEMARDDVFESDQELDAFLAHVYAERHANLT